MPDVSTTIPAEGEGAYAFKISTPKPNATKSNQVPTVNTQSDIKKRLMRPTKIDAVNRPELQLSPLFSLTLVNNYIKSFRFFCVLIKDPVR